MSEVETLDIPSVTITNVKANWVVNKIPITVVFRLALQIMELRMKMTSASDNKM